MPPKKGKGKGKKAKKEGDEDTKAEKQRIIDEIYNAPNIEDYPMNLEMAQKLVETENIEFFVLVDRMQDINRRLEKDTANLIATKEVEDAKIVEQNEKMKVLRDDNFRKRRRDKGEKEDWKGKKSQALQVFEDQRINFDDEIKKLRDLFEPQLASKRDEIAELQATKNDLLDFKENEAVKEAELQFWQQEVAEQQAAHKALIEGIEKDRIKQIDRLRKDMLMQIRTVRMKNSVTNEDQLQGTTKLTVIQNMQLTAELDYQSKRTEDLMFKNHEMKGLITNLSKDLEDHKEVEKELAKRSHFCQKVIQKYKQQIEDLKTEIDQTDQQFKQESKRQAQDTEQQDLMNYLNTRIQQIEQKLQTTTSHFTLQEEEYQSLLEKMISIRNRYSKVILLLTEFIESFVEHDPQILQKQNDIFLDIDAVKEADDLREVDGETLVALGLVLLKQLQPYVQDLSDVKHQENYMRKNQNGAADNSVIHEVETAMNQSTGLHELENRAVLLKMSEDEQKLSFTRGNAANAKGSRLMAYNSSGNIQDYDEGRQNVPTRGQTNGAPSMTQDGYDHSSYVRSSQKSGIVQSGAFKSGMHNYASSGVNSGLSRREQGYTTHQAAAFAYKAPGVSRLPMVDPSNMGGNAAQLKQNFMHLRTGANRSGLHSLDRNRGGGVGVRSRGNNYLPKTNSTQRRDSRLNYNSSSIPYLNKRGGFVDSGLTQHHGNPGSGLPPSQEVQKRPMGYDPVRMGNHNKPINTSGLPSVL